MKDSHTWSQFPNRLFSGFVRRQQAFCFLHGPNYQVNETVGQSMFPFCPWNSIRIKNNQNDLNICFWDASENKTLQNSLYQYSMSASEGLIAGGTNSLMFGSSFRQTVEAHGKLSPNHFPFLCAFSTILPALAFIILENRSVLTLVVGCISEKLSTLAHCSGFPRLSLGFNRGTNSFSKYSFLWNQYKFSLLKKGWCAI